eukprot:10339472-Alexandrium_andersonii.AAC.1
MPRRCRTAPAGRRLSASPRRGRARRSPVPLGPWPKGPCQAVAGARRLPWPWAPRPPTPAG